MDLIFWCGCCRRWPCAAGAKLFAVADWEGLVRHGIEHLQVNRPYPEQQAERRTFATIGDAVRRRA